MDAAVERRELCCSITGKPWVHGRHEALVLFEAELSIRFHGEADPMVPVAASRVMIDALKKAGGTPRYDEYPGIQHNSWDKAYANPELYEWFLKHTLK